MKHLDSGELRRMLDDPKAFDDHARLHAQTCEECRARGALITGDASHAASVLGGSIAVDSGRAYARLSERLSARPQRPAWHLPAVAAALAACFTAMLLFTPLGGYARSFLTVFEPQRFEPVRVSRADLQDLHLLPQAHDVGVQRVVRKPERTHYATIADAQARASFRLLRPTALPQRFGVVRSFTLSSPGEMSFTFSAAKARAFERRSHKELPAMPPGLDGTTVRLQIGQVFHAHYEATPVARSGSHTASLEIVEALAPRVTSSGASVEQLERYLLSMPNVSPNLAAQIQALGDIQNTVPVPVIIDKQTAHPVDVNGASGLAIGDNTGLGAGVMWQKNGMIYVVAGPLSMNEVLAVADGLR